MRSREVIQAANARGDAALLGFLPLGFPSVDRSIDAAKILVDNGFDVIELGFPYSDPGMDGPVIQQASKAALEHGTHLEDLFYAVEKLTDYGTSVVSMTYWNPVFWYGTQKFSRDFAAAGGAGVITPDLPPEEAGDWIRASDEYGLERIFLSAPTSPQYRLELISEASNGWVYAASTMGVTGTRATLDAGAKGLVERTYEAGAKVVCVGIGVSTGQQAHEVGTFANGVIVGSALVKPLVQLPWGEAQIELAKRAQALAAGVRGVRQIN